MSKPPRKLHEANAKIADWGGFTAEEMAQHALDLGIPTDVTCATEKEKAAVLKALKGKKGADRVEVLTLDEYEARVKKTFDHIARTAVNPETTSFSNPEPEAEPAPRSRRRKSAEPVKERRGEDRPAQPEPNAEKTIYVFDIDYGDVKDQQGRREIRRKLIKEGWTIIRKGEQ